ncbi:MAG TPA: GntR family transcriptional regulator [Burkholderiales bacterium]|nr:GntR family transcriptional regulator [Burkholderiales bacterium]
MKRTEFRGRPATARPTAGKRTKVVTDEERKPSLAESVYLGIKQDIFDFRLLPGDRFTENEVATRLNVSRTPAREALYRLERDGYLQVHFRSGWSVRELDFKQFDDLYDLRIALETAAVIQLCDQAERPKLEELKSVWLVPTEARLTDGERVCALDEAFHCALVAATGNREMTRCHQEVTERIHLLRRLDFTEAGRIAATYQEHAQILRAVLRQDSDRASGLLRAHIETSKIEVRKISLHKLLSARRS